MSETSINNHFVMHLNFAKGILIRVDYDNSFSAFLKVQGLNHLIILPRNHFATHIVLNIIFNPFPHIKPAVAQVKVAHFKTINHYHVVISFRHAEDNKITKSSSASFQTAYS